MRYMMIVKANKDSEAGKMPSEELLAAMGKYNEELMKAGVLIDEDHVFAGRPPRRDLGGKCLVVGDDAWVTLYEERICPSERRELGDHHQCIGRRYDNCIEQLAEPLGRIGQVEGLQDIVRPDHQKDDVRRGIERR